MIRYLLAVVAALQLALPTVAVAQDYPNRPIRLIVGYAPGGGTDILARLMAQHLRTALGQPVVVENRPGAGETIADAMVARAAPDGYTLLMAAAAVTINPFLYKDLAFDVSRDLTGVAVVANSPVVLVVHSSLPVTSVAELVSHAKANPGKLAYATPGVGTVQHLASELFRSMTRTELIHVPYKGGAPAMSDLAAGQVQLSFAAITSAQPFIRSGRLRALGTGDERRSELAGGLPTIGETVPGYEVSIWYGILAPAGTPKAIVDRLNRELAAIVQLKEVKAQMFDQGYESAVEPPESMNRRIRADLDKWGRAAKQAGIKPE